LIGQFGVGFYSAFMVANQITLVTRRAGEESATKWESTGNGQYSVAESERAGHRTSITLKLKPVDREIVRKI
jgi:molecular chaperone HtpG